MKIKVTILAVFLAVIQCFGSSDEPPRKEADGLNILPTNLAKLARDKSPVPPDLSIGFNEWKKKKITEELLRRLLTFKFESKKEGKPYKERIREVPQMLGAKRNRDINAIEQAGYKNESQANYVFKVKALLDHLLKTSGSGNRFMSSKFGHGLSWNDEISEDIMQKILSGEKRTFQTASRMATYLALQDLIKSKNFKHVRVPKTYLVTLDDSDKVDDNNAIILSDPISAKAKKITNENVHEISDVMIRELVRAIAVGGLWSSWDGGNLYVDGDKLYIVDLEQPNNSKPQDFFHQNAYKYHSDISVGIDHLLNLLKHNKAKLNVAIEAIQQDPLLGTSDYERKGTTDELVAKLSPIIEKAPSKQSQK